MSAHETLRPWLEHHRNCRVNEDPSGCTAGPCTCGLNAALSAPLPGREQLREQIAEQVRIAAHNPHDTYLPFDEIPESAKEYFRGHADRILALLPEEGASPAPESGEVKRLRANVQGKRYIDMTPDAGMIGRILTAYIDDSTVTDNTLGLPPESPLLKAMNEAQVKRNELLRAALAAPQSPEPPAPKYVCHKCGKRKFAYECLPPISYPHYRDDNGQLCPGPVVPLTEKEEKQ